MIILIILSFIFYFLLRLKCLFIKTLFTQNKPLVLTLPPTSSSEKNDSENDYSDTACKQVVMTDMTYMCR